MTDPMARTTDDPSNRPPPPDPRKCTARKRDGDPCTRWAIKGATVCAVHGGRAPQVKAAAARRVAEQAAATELAAGLEEAAARWSGTHPIESAERARAVASAAMDDLFRRLSDPDFDGVVVQRRGKDGGVVSTSLQVSFTMEQLRAWTELAGKLGKASLDAGTEERRVGLEESRLALDRAVVVGALVEMRGWLAGELAAGAAPSAILAAWDEAGTTAVLGAIDALEVGEGGGQ